MDKKSHDGELPVRLCNYTDVYYSDTIQGSAEFMVATATVDELARFRLQRGQVLITKDSETPDDIAEPAYVDAEEPDLVCGYHLSQITPGAQLDGRYLFWWMSSATARERLSLEAAGVTRFGLRLDSIASLPLRLPDLDQQRRIAEYLDAETERIDALITAKTQMIELLEERRAERIDSLVWGSNGDGTWERPAFNAVIDIAEGQVDPTASPYSELLLIAPNHVESGSGRLLDRETAQAQGAISGKYLCAKGDVIYSKIRPALQKAVIAPERCLTSADMYPLRPHSCLRPAFLFYFVLSRRFTDMAVMESERVAMPKINREALGRLRVPLPPVEEQDRIVFALEEMRTHTESAIGLLAAQLELLRERRRSLITAVVTGEMEVA